MVEVGKMIEKVKSDDIKQQEGDSTISALPAVLDSDRDDVESATAEVGSAMSAVEPVAPTVESAIPEVEPAALEVGPAALEVEPTAPMVEPEAPEVEPEASKAKPTTPAVEPATPAVEPCTPADESCTPAVEPCTPAAEPTTAIARPSTPVRGLIPANPEPCTPMVESPTAMVESPMSVVESPMSIVESADQGQSRTVIEPSTPIATRQLVQATGALEVDPRHQVGHPHYNPAFARAENSLFDDDDEGIVLEDGEVFRFPPVPASRAFQNYRPNPRHQTVPGAALVFTPVRMRARANTDSAIRPRSTGVRKGHLRNKSKSGGSISLSRNSGCGPSFGDIFGKRPGPGPGPGPGAGAGGGGGIAT